MPPGEARRVVAVATDNAPFPAAWIATAAFTGDAWAGVEDFCSPRGRRSAAGGRTRRCGHVRRRHCHRSGRSIRRASKRTERLADGGNQDASKSPGYSPGIAKDGASGFDSVPRAGSDLPPAPQPTLTPAPTPTPTPATPTPASTTGGAAPGTRRLRRVGWTRRFTTSAIATAHC